MNVLPAQSAEAAHRDRSIRLAVLTSLMSKFGTILLRLVSIPIAIRLLGIEQFGVYAAITMAVGLIDMLHIGIGPALTRELSKALAAKDREKEKTIFVTSVVVSTALTLLAATAAAVLLYRVPIPRIFGSEFAEISSVMYSAAWLGLAIITIEMICLTPEMGRDGYMETRFTNAWGAAGNVVGAIALVTGVWFFPTIEFLLIAVNGSLALAKLGNTIHLFVQRPYLLPRLPLFQYRLIPPLVKDSIRFSVTYILAAMLEYNALIFLIGRFVGPDAVGVFQIMITIHFSLTGIVAMITKPYWPALMDAFTRRDRAWILRSSNRLRLGGAGFAILTGIGLVALGPLALHLWVGEQIHEVTDGFRLDRIALLAFSAYFLLHVWRHINQTLALGAGALNPVVCVVLVEGVFLLSLATYALVHTGSLSIIYATMAATMLLFSGWLFPLLFRRGLASQDDDAGDAGAVDVSETPPSTML